MFSMCGIIAALTGAEFYVFITASLCQADSVVRIQQCQAAYIFFQNSGGFSCGCFELKEELKSKIIIFS